MDIVIFGITGDLSKKKLLPALEHLTQSQALQFSDLRIVGFSRSAPSFEVSLNHVFVQGSYDNKDDFLKLKNTLRAEKPQLFFLALPPSAHRDVLENIHEVELVTKDDPSGFRIILIEKPFGRGYEDAKSLIMLIKEYFRDDQCLKVDHYAGKKELRNLEDHDFALIKEISFGIEETSRVEGRNAYYDSTGALRDVGQNHLLLMLATFFKGEGKREDILEHLSVNPDEHLYEFASYEGYGITDTKFFIPAIIDTEELRNIKITLHGGKGLSENKASIVVTHVDGTKKEIILTSGTAAYEQIFIDALAGKSVSFLSDEEVLASWKFIEEVEKIKKNLPLSTYLSDSLNGVK
jgi:glucose-6-phosphate 1-dehydrogenase